MRNLCILSIVILSGLLLTEAQTPEARISGNTQDCFVGGLFHPAGVDIYLLDPQQTPKIIQVLRDLHRELEQRKEEQFFASYLELQRQIHAAKPVGHVFSDKSGHFSFDKLHSGKRYLVLGMSEREDDPAYYAHTTIEALRPGETVITLDFAGDAPCQAEPTGPVRPPT